jgi:hypothetical protein
VTAPPEPDVFETLYARGVTDGLPVVAPTAARVEAAVEASGRPRDGLVGLVAPKLGRATVEKVAINAVMAGCRPEYMPAVIAAVEAICDPAFALVGVSGTTDAVALLLILNGPIRSKLDVNSGAGVFGPGWRANATIGRAVRLVWQNVGGAAAGGVSMSTFSQTGRYSYCIGENEEESPWEPLHVEHGFAADDSTVAAIAAEAPQVVANTMGRTAREILATIARSGVVIASETHAGLGDTVLVIGPEHARTIAADGWSKEAARQFVWEQTQADAGGHGVTKFRAPANVRIVVAGGTAGRFSAWIPGWPFPNSPSGLVFKRI